MHWLEETGRCFEGVLQHSKETVMARYTENVKVGSAVASVASVLAMLAMASAAVAVTVDGRVEPGEYLTTE